MPPTMMVTVGALALAVPAAAAPAPPAVEDPEALLAQAAIVVAARKAAPAAPIRLVFMNSPLSLVLVVLLVVVRTGWSRCWVRWVRARATRRRRLHGSAAAASAAGAARGG